MLYCWISAGLLKLPALWNICKTRAEITGDQNKLAQIALMAPRRSSAEPLLRYFHWLPFAQRIKYKIAMLTHRVLATGQPPYLSELLQRKASLRTTRSTNMELLAVPDFRLELSRKTLNFAAPTVWNTLPIEIRRRLSPTVCKTELKTYLFNAAYSN